MQDSFAFPQPLTEKYRPIRIADFAGLDKPKKAMANLVANPRPLNLLFLGPSGTGKTTMGLAVTSALPAELHHVPAKECNLETIQELCRQCHYMPRMLNDWTTAVNWHVILIDEADQMSYPAQLALLSVLDNTNRPPNTIIILTANATANLEDRFLSRCQKFEFSSYGMSSEIVGLLSQVWACEAGAANPPNFGRIVKDSCNNVRDALMSLETELMCA